MNFLKGKRTYVIIAVFLILVLVPAIFGILIPEWIYGIISALGLTFLRAAIQEISGNKGWKTYAAAIVVAGISIANGLGAALPLDIIYSILGAFGILGVRSAVEKLKT